MKTTASTRNGWMAVGLILTSSIIWAGGTLSAKANEGSSNAASAEDKSQQAIDLLRRARQAMAENNLAAADTLISQADALGVEYSGFYLGDTPKKARHDLEKKRNPAGTVSVSKLFAPLMGDKPQTPSADPFVGRGPQTPASDPNMAHLPQVGSNSQAGMASASSAPERYPSTTYNRNAPSEDNSSSAGFSVAQSNNDNTSPLLEARRALAVGDVRRATSLTQVAKQQNRQYGPLDDSPEKVEAAISKIQSIATLDKQSEAYRRALARNALEQAEAFIRWGDLEQAEKLAMTAASQRVMFSPMESNPQEVLGRILAMKRTGPSEDSHSGAGMSVAASSSYNATQQAQAKEFLRQAREAIAAGQMQRAEQLANKASQFRLPDNAFGSGEDRPSLVLSDLRLIQQNNASRVMPAANYEVAQASGQESPNRQASTAMYDANNDSTRNITVADQQSPRMAPPRYQQQEPLPVPPMYAPESAGNQASPNSAMGLFQQGEAALRNHNKEEAYQCFTQAAARMNDLDPLTAQRLQDHLQLLSNGSQANGNTNRAPSMLDETAARQQVLARQVAADLAHVEANARATRETDPKGALALLEEARAKVEAAGLDTAAREQLLRRADRAIAESKQFVAENQPRIELMERNNHTRSEIEREQRVKIEKQERIALLADEFSRLIDEQRYEQAQIVAKKAEELDANDPIVQQLVTNAKFMYRVMSNRSLQSDKEEGYWSAMDSVDQSSVPQDDRNPIQFPDAKKWKDMTGSRAKFLTGNQRQRTERELEIERKLRTPVSLEFTNTPLSKVIDYLAKIAEINVHLDPKGLAEEGITTDTPVTIEVRNEIMLKSALNLILNPLRLSYVVKDEVLKITSEQARDGEVYKVVYNVADLVVPIPNFQPQAMGLDSAYHAAMGNVGFGGSSPFFGSTATPLAVVSNKDNKAGNTSLNPALLAQMGGTGGTQSGQTQSPVGFGPGGLGGGTQADFDSLIDLIISTVKPTTWDDVGGPGSIAPFETNLSIVVSQTQDVHEEIVDLLQQLRRMQDLQVTIEVRFITLNDSFFERIGVDFDFNIRNEGVPQQVGFGSIAVPGNPATNTPPVLDTLRVDRNKSWVVGQQSPGVFTADLDVPFTQNSYGLAIPQFGGFDATAGASLGFAILSDIEAYFFINAAQGDKRSNVLQAPKVTLFNGQQAFVSDTSQSPFVISVIPVVGDFAAAQQPVIVVLSEGTFMTVQAVVSNDRRYVRLTVVPFFSKIDPNVKTFTFTGSETTTTDTTRDGNQTDPNDATKQNDSSSTTKSGTSVQLPTFSYVTVTTTVSVPDGGTVLLGGIKRLSEGRTEYGVPMLNKVPYINRLFKNVGIGRETQSLMMMVTPRIIIQEEEEDKLGVNIPD